MFHTFLTYHFYPRPVLASWYCRCLRLSAYPCASPSVTKFVRAITHHPFKLGSPNLDHRCKTPCLISILFLGWFALTCKVKFNFKVKICPIKSLWVCPRYRSPTNEVKISKCGPKCIFALLLSLLILGLIDLSLQFHFEFQTCYLYQTWRFLFICVVLYILSEAIANECSTSHMAPHIY